MATVPVHVSRAAAAYALLGGLVSFAGWVTEIDVLRDWTGAGITIKANASLAAAASGAALLMHSSRLPRSKTVVRVLGSLVAIVGGLTLLQHVTGWNLGIDTLMFDEPPGSPATAAPGRMGPPASTSYLAIGIATVLLTCAGPVRRFSVGLGVGVLAIGMLSLTGHWYGAETMYTIPRLTGIAAQTATMLAALGIGVIAANPDRQPVRTLVEPGIAGQLARRLVPLVIGLPLVIGRLRIEGERFNLYDPAFGAALRSLIEVSLFSAFVWWSIRAIRERDAGRRKAEDDLRLSEQRLGHTLASITDGFVTLDHEWRFAYVNPEAERFLDRPSANVLGRIIWEVFPERVGSNLYHGLRRAMRERETVEVQSSERNGERHFNHRVYPTADGGLSIYIQDVTLREQAQAALREADRRKDEFLAMLAHELRNPLAPIRNAANLLAIKGGGSEPQIEWGTGIIRRQVQHMSRLLEDLLDVSRISRNRLELRTEWLELTEVVQSAAETSRPAIDAAGQQLTVDLPEEPIYVDGDRVRLSQVLSNLLNNAAKYGKRGGHVGLGIRCEGDGALVTVSDDGAGIPQSMLPHIFDMFVQGGADGEGGLGIGLWLAKGIIERHGGNIEARSAGPGTGSTFVVRLPRLVDVGRTAAPSSASIGPDVPSRRVLVVDDVMDSADTLAALLELLGHVAEKAYNAADAMTVGRSFRPEAILLDIGMPDIDGFEACRRIRATAWGRNACIIALTGWGQPHDRQQSRDAGFDHHLIKPADVDALSSLLAGLSPAVAEESDRVPASKPV